MQTRSKETPREEKLGEFTIVYFDRGKRIHKYLILQ